MNGTTKIAILVETQQEFQIVRPHLAFLKEWDVPFALTLASGLKSPARLASWIVEREHEGAEVFIVAVGGAANLAGEVAAKTDRPVIGVPLDVTRLRGQDALHAMTEMPLGLPIAVVGINGVRNAFYCAFRILALHNSEYRVLLNRMRNEWPQQELNTIENLRDQYPEIFAPQLEEMERRIEPDVDREMDGGTKTAVAPEPHDMTGEAPESSNEAVRPSRVPTPPPRSRGPRSSGRRIVVDPSQPDVDAIEEISDILLEGGIVALPTDTVYGLAALATDPDAVRRLYALKERPMGKPIPLLIHSTRNLPRLVRKIPDAVLPLLDELWPGALTLIFSKYPDSFNNITNDETIGLRMPNHTVTLAVISMLARPLAVTSANISGRPPALTADDAIESFGSSVDCVLDAGKTPGENVSTVLSVVEEPFRILRQGAVSRERLKAILGDNLAD